MDNKESLEQLLLTLKNRLAPTLYFVCCNNDYIEAAIKKDIIESLPEYKHHQLDVSNRTVESLTQTIKQVLPAEVINSKPLEYIVHIDGLEMSLFATEDGKFSHTRLPEEMNFERELLFNGFPFVTIIWSSQYFYKELFKKAPDLSNWLINYYEFKADENINTPINEVPIKEALPYKGALPRRIERIKKLEVLLSRLNREAPDQQKIMLEKMNAWLLLGKEYAEAFQWQNAEKAYLNALHIAEQLKQNYKTAEIYYHLGDLFLYANQFNNALGYYKKCQELVIELNKINNISGTYQQIGIVYAKQRNWQEALSNYNKAIEWKEKAGNRFALGDTYHQVGMVYAEQQNWGEALANYNKAIEWDEKTGSEFNIGDTYHQVGIVYAEQQNWKKALSNYNKAIEWKEKTGNQFELGGTYHQIGMVYEEQQNWEEALVNYNKAIDWKVRTGNRFRLGSTYYQIGMVHQRQQNWEEALISYYKAIEWDEKTGNQFELGNTYYLIGMVYEKQEKIEEATEFYKKAVDNLRQFNHPNLAVAEDSLKRVSNLIVQAK